MATSAFDSFDDEDMRPPPILRHPAFPAVVAAWFATLLGLGTLVLPVLLLERLVDATGLPALLPAAAAPLGATARALIALVAATGGAAAGWGIARRVAGSRDTTVEPQRARYPAGLRRPISVREELGDECLFEDFGLPAPGYGPDNFEEREALDSDFAPALSDEQGGDDMDAPDPEPAWPNDEIEPVHPARDAAKLPPHDAGGEPLAFMAPSRARRAAEAHACDQHLSGESREPAPLDELGLVDLAERLRASIERRRESAVQAGNTAASAHRVPAGLEAAPAEDAAQAMAAYFGRPTAIGARSASTAERPERDAGVDETGSDAMTPLHGNGLPPAPGSAETDAALRNALANLQRMSGGA